MSLPAVDHTKFPVQPDESMLVAQSLRPGSGVVDDHDGQLVGASLALALLRIIPEAAYVTDLDGRVTFINCAGLHHLGASRMVHRPDGSYLWDLWPDAPQAELRNALADAGEGERVELRRIGCPQFDGPAASCQVSVSPVENARGQVAKILVLAQVA